VLQEAKLIVDELQGQLGPGANLHLGDGARPQLAERRIGRPALTRGKQ
jgi:hypothetical protein